MSADKCGRYETEAEERVARRERMAIANKASESGEMLRDIRGVKRRDRKENRFARPDGLAKTMKQ